MAARDAIIDKRCVDADEVEKDLVSTGDSLLPSTRINQLSGCHGCGQGEGDTETQRMEGNGRSVNKSSSHLVGSK